MVIVTSLHFQNLHFVSTKATKHRNIQENKQQQQQQSLYISRTCLDVVILLIIRARGRGISSGPTLFQPTPKLSLPKSV